MTDHLKAVQSDDPRQCWRQLLNCFRDVTDHPAVKLPTDYARWMNLSDRFLSVAHVEFKQSRGGRALDRCVADSRVGWLEGEVNAWMRRAPPSATGLMG